MPLLWFFLGMLTTAAILCVLLPWLRTIPSLESLPALPWHTPLAALLVIGAALAMYRWLGRPDLAVTAAGTPTPMPIAAGAAGTATSASAGSMESALASLEGKLSKGGGSDGDWELLAKTYDFVGRSEDAAKARGHTLTSASAASGASGASATLPEAEPAPALTPETLKLLAKASRARSDKQYSAAVTLYSQLAARGQLNADAWADYADAVASVQGGKLSGMPVRYIDRSLALDPKQPKALWLKASAQEEADQWSDAVRTWRQLASLLPPESEDAKIIAANLQRDASMGAASTAGTADAAPRVQPAALGVATAVSGEVTVANALAGKARRGSTLFVVAKSVDSPGPPVAVFRGTVDTWPVKFTLDDSQAMLPGRNLSSAARVTVEARVSQSGQALPASGDLRSRSAAVEPGDARSLKIVIDEVVQ